MDIAGKLTEILSHKRVPVSVAPCLPLSFRKLVEPAEISRVFLFQNFVITGFGLYKGIIIWIFAVMIFAVDKEAFDPCVTDAALMLSHRLFIR